MSVEDIEKRRAARKAAHEQAKAEQELKDLEAIDALEEESGEPLHTMTANRYQQGCPVKIAYRAPTGVEYKRYCDMVGAAMKKNDHQARQKAQELLAQACLVYPVDESRKSMLEAFPGLLISLAIEAAKVAELRSEEEGKG